MDMLATVERFGAFWSPGVSAALVGVAILMAWMAFRPAPPHKDVQHRLDDYVERIDVVVEEDLRGSFASRALVPALRSFLRLLGRLLPGRNLEATRVQIQ